MIKGRALCHASESGGGWNGGSPGPLIFKRKNISTLKSDIMSQS